MEVIRKYAVKNAIDFGKAETKAVLGKVLADSPELRGRVAELIPLIEKIVEEVNDASKGELEGEIKKYEFIKKKERRTGLSELKNTENVVLRFAPNPSGPLHLGHSRAAVLNDEYAKRYDGKLILRIEDTDPARVDPDAYDMIEEDLKWLGVKFHEKEIQSDRLDIYYDYCKKLLEMGNAYVCICNPNAFQQHRVEKAECSCRKNKSKENLAKYERMFAEYREGAAVVRLKTGMELKDPSMRDFPLMRISEHPHPRVKERRVYPLMNFSVAIDDHLSGMTHVLRGKDHIPNIKKQGLIYDCFGWAPPEYIHYGRLKIEELALSTSKTKEGIEKGEYSGWDDVKLGTLRAMKRRGIQPAAIRKAMIDVGTKRSDIKFSWKNLYAYNRDLIERDAKRYFFIDDPKELMVAGTLEFEITAPLHPDSDLGIRKLGRTSQGETKFYISGSDFEIMEPGKLIRLMEALNIELTDKKEATADAKFVSRDLEDARQKKAKLVHWVLGENLVKVRVISPDGTIQGFGEPDLMNVKVGEIIQFERFGFVKLDKKNDEMVFYFTHK